MAQWERSTEYKCFALIFRVIAFCFGFGYVFWAEKNAHACLEPSEERNNCTQGKRFL